MLNGRGILIRILCVFFVATPVFGQQQSDSHVIKVTQEIDIAMLNKNVEDLNKNMKTLTETIDKLNENVKTLGTTVGDLKTTVARIDERTKGIAGWQYATFGVMGTIFASMVVYFLTQWISSRKKWNSESEATPASTAQMSQNEVVPTTPIQATPAEILQVMDLPKRGKSMDKSQTASTFVRK